MGVFGDIGDWFKNNGGRLATGVATGGISEIARNPSNAWMGPLAAGSLGAAEQGKDLYQTATGGSGGGAAPQPFTSSAQPSAFAPHSTGGGLQPIEQDKSMGLDMTKPGAAESFWGQNQGKLDGPTMASNFWSKSGSAVQGPTQMEDFAAQTQQRYGTGPQISTDAGRGAYYDRAKERAVESIDSSLAARGAYGSSVGLGQIGETVADIEANRARDEADYALRASQEQRGWMDSLGGVQQAASRDRLDRFRTGVDASTTVDRGELDRFRTGMDASSMAQGHQRQRGRDFVGDMYQAGNTFGGMAGDTYGTMLDQDQAIMDAILALEIGQGAEGVAGAYRQEGRAMDNRERQDDQMRAMLEALDAYNRGA